MHVRVHYPLEDGRLVLRADADWERDVPPVRSARDGRTFDFQLDGDAPFHYFKPAIVRGEETVWAQGDNCLAVQPAARMDVFPHFEPDSRCHECTLQEVPASFAEKGRRVRVFLPPGHDENTLQRYPVLYMQDGHNLFFPDEAASGSHWRIAETLALLTSMNLIRKVIVVGIYPEEREREYTAPGYEAYGRFLVEELKPWVDARYRTLPQAKHTAVLGSSLGGVVSFSLAWQWPEVFGAAGCMSSTFGYRDDLLRHVLEEPRRPIRVYLDSGWPRDNFEATRSMNAALLSRGYRKGKDLQYLAFPEAGHTEAAWAARVHLPFQFFFGE